MPAMFRRRIVPGYRGAARAGKRAGLPARLEDCLPFAVVCLAVNNPEVWHLLDVRLAIELAVREQTVQTDQLSCVPFIASGLAEDLCKRGGVLDADLTL